MAEPANQREQASELWAAAVHPVGRAQLLVAGDGTLLEWGAEAEAVYGYPADAMLGQSVARLATDESRAELMALIAAAAEDGRLHVAPVLQRREDGARIRAIVRAGGVPIPEGDPPNVRLICQDADAYQLAVREAEARGGGDTALFDLMSEHVYLKDRDLVFRYAGEAFAHGLGSTADEVVGKTDYDFFPRELAEQYREDDRRTMAAGRPVETVEDVGRLGPARKLKVPLMGADGKPAGILGSWSWLDAREQVRRQLAHSLGLIAGLGDAVIGTDRAANVLSWSPGAERLYGYKAEDIRGQSLAVLVPAEGRPDMLADVRQAAAGEWIPDSEALHIGADGTELQVMMSLCPVVTPGGGITGLSVLVRDIRERVSAARQRVSLHAQLEQTKKLESLGILAGGIAHDFNALLTGILGNTALATADLPVSSPVRARLEEIEQATHRAAHLCAQMLAYSGRGRFIVQPLDLSGFVRRATRLLEAAVPQKCVVEYQLADGLPPAEADESQLRQVLMNLVTNAAEAIGQRTGFLVVHTGLCTADRDYLDHAILGGQRQEGEYVFLEVADTGCGMDDETRRCAFDPFFSTKLTGRGLGLAAVLGIVRGHGGAIHLDTQPDAGTRIRVLLPAVRAPAHKEGAERPWSDEGTLLVAGRDRLESLMARTVLTQAGFTVLAASSADEAVRLLGVHGGGISAALVDIGDADEDALRLPVRLREVRRDLPIVVVATVSEARARDRAGVPDPVLYIRRPASREKLIGAFRDVLGREEPG